MPSETFKYIRSLQNIIITDGKICLGWRRLRRMLTFLLSRRKCTLQVKWVLGAAQCTHQSSKQMSHCCLLRPSLIVLLNFLPLANSIWNFKASKPPLNIWWANSGGEITVNVHANFFSKILSDCLRKVCNAAALCTSAQLLHLAWGN